MDERATIAELERRLAAAEAALLEKAGIEAALRESEELRRVAVEGGRMGTWRSNLRDQVISGDAVFMAVWGLPPTDGPRPYSQFLERMSSQGRDLMDAMIAGTPMAGAVFDGEHAVVGGPTAGRWVRWRGCAEREHPWIVNGVCFDVTDQRRSEERLRESEARHRLLIESWAQAVWEADPAGVIVADSSSWRAYTGQTLDQWLGYGWLDAIHSDDRAYAERQWREAIATRGLVDAEFRLRTPDEGWRWTKVVAAPVLDEAGEIEKWVGMNIDVDARKRAEVSLRASEEKFRTVFQSIDEGFCIVETIRNASGELVDLAYREANEAYAKQAGFRPSPGLRVKEIAPDIEPDWMAFYDRVSRSGVPEAKEDFNADLDRWFRTQVTRVGPAGSPLLGIVFEDVTERKRAEIALKESEERQAFLLRLSDALRPLGEPSELMATASAMLGSSLGVGRCGYGEVTSAGDLLVIERDWTDGVMDSLQGAHRLADFGDAFISAYRAGETVVLDDVYADARGEGVEQAFEEIGALRASLAVPLVKGGRWTAVFYVQQSAPRRWTRGDRELVQDVAERTWAAVERARAEKGLRESEERFQRFAASSSDVLWIRDGQTLAMEFVSEAARGVYGVEPDTLLGGAEAGIAMIVPEDRQQVFDSIARLRSGEAVAHDFRIQRPDGAFRWMRSAGFPLVSSGGGAEKIGGITTDITEAKLATEHQAVLLAELQHRVRNIMALVRSITARTAESAASVEDYAERVAGRLLTLSRVQALLTQAANVGVSIATIVRDELSAAAGPDHPCGIEGPDLVLAPKAAEVLTLAIHELATNAVKYGGLSGPGGGVAVGWHTFERRGKPWLRLDWSEHGAPARPHESSQPRRGGFGRELIEARVPYELGGRGQVRIGPGGAVAELEFPLRGGDSILETDAPMATAVFGGALDMSGEADLTGHTVLVVEDDYYLANDTARALKGAGAEVIGPCPNAEAALDLLEKGRPTTAVVDINLGEGGPSFEVARALRKRAIPLVFLTGYDQQVIPAEFCCAQRLQKPIALRDVVKSIAATAGASAGV